MVDQSVMQRLAFIKYMVTLALEQSHQAEPLSAISILMFHDSVELFLRLAAEHANVDGKDKSDFMQYFGDYQKKMGQPLYRRGSMEELNNARISLKHFGNLPAHLAIEKHRVNVRDFFEKNTKLVFGINFDDISMLSLVKSERVRVELEEAQPLIDTHNHPLALAKIAIAFEKLIEEHQEPQGYDAGYFVSTSQIPNFQSILKYIPTDNNLERYDPKTSSFAVNGFFNQLEKMLRSMEDTIKMLGLGLDYRAYTRFRKLVPTVVHVPGGRYVTESSSSQKPVSSEECWFCYNFVINTAILLQGT